MTQLGFELSFSLREIADVGPWQDAEGEYLRWFGLTDGTYDLHLNGQSIFEYTEAASEHFELDRATATSATHVEYQVARLFHDLSWTMPSIVNDPVPSAIHELVDDPEKLARLVRLHKDTVSEPRRSQISQGLSWLFSRTIDSGHLVQGPTIALWRHHETVYAWCDSSDRVIESKPVWAYEPLFESVSVDDFETEVAHFQTRLLDAMEARIDDIELGGQLPATVRIDVDELRTQQAKEIETANRHRTIQPVTDWEAAAAALRTL